MQHPIIVQVRIFAIFRSFKIITSALVVDNLITAGVVAVQSPAIFKMEIRRRLQDHLPVVVVYESAGHPHSRNLQHIVGYVKTVFLVWLAIARNVFDIVGVCHSIVIFLRLVAYVVSEFFTVRCNIEQTSHHPALREHLVRQTVDRARYRGSGEQRPSQTYNSRFLVHLDAASVVTYGNRHRQRSVAHLINRQVDVGLPGYERRSEINVSVERLHLWRRWQHGEVVWRILQIVGCRRQD